MRRKKIALLGSGFASVYAYLELCRQYKKSQDIEIVWISKNDYFYFIVLLHEVAVGNLTPQSIIQPLRMLPRYPHSRIVIGSVTKVDFDTKKITVSVENSGNNNYTYNYDTCVMALGSETNFYGTPGADEYCYTLKNINDAKNIKQRIISRFELASLIDDSDERLKKLHTVVIGGGPTGVEIAAEVADFILCELTDAFPNLCSEARVTLIQKGEKLTPQMEPWFCKRVHSILAEKLNVRILLNTGVKEVKKGSVTIDNGDPISAETIIWTAGVKAVEIDIHASKGVSLEKRTHQIRVNEYLQVPEYKDVYVIGDQAYAVNNKDCRNYPMRAQFAVQMGIRAAKNIIAGYASRRTTKFYWKDQGFIVSLGKGGALAKIFGVKLSGPFAWWLYRTAYLIRIVGTKAKLRTMLEWTLNLFYSRDITRL